MSLIGHETDQPGRCVDVRWCGKIGTDGQALRATLIGTWKVLSLKAVSEDKVSYPLGDQVTGFVTITPTRFWLLFVDGTRKAPAAPALTDAEAIALMKTQVAWTGKYTTTEQTAEGIKLTAHVDTASSSSDHRQ